MKISVIGAGYVGLTTAACLAQIGHDVFCAEKDLDKLAQLESGKVPIFEPHLESVIEDARKANRLHFGSAEDAIAWGIAIFICVGTPPLPNGDADLHAIEAVARTIAKQSSGYRLIVEKSTVPVQTGAQLRKHLAFHSTRELDYDVVSNPEFLREGSAVGDFLHPDHIVVGVESARATQLMREIYEPILQRNFVCPIHKDCSTAKENVFLVTDTNSAELIKHASNSFLAMKISFINMVADLCEVVGADVGKVSQGMGLDPRIGSAFLNPGIGFGGFCFPKDIQAFIRIGEKSGCNFSLLKEVEQINRQRIVHLTEKIRKELWSIRGKKIAVWGLAFKPNTDDVRFAPSIALMKALTEEGAVVSAYDPQAAAKAKAVLPDIDYCANPYLAARGVDAIVIATEWDEFRRLDWDLLRETVEGSVIFDGRNMLDAEEVASHGFHYIGVGQAPVGPTPKSSADNSPEVPQLSLAGMFANPLA